MGRMGCGKQGWIDAGAAAAGHTHPTLRATFPPSKAGEGKRPLTRACDRIPIAHAIDAEMSFDGRQPSTLSLAH
jgi:hypothetical protein